MPSYRGSWKRKPWHARAKRNGYEYGLGCYETIEEAIEVEQAFDRLDPKQRQYFGRHQRSA